MVCPHCYRDSAETSLLWEFTEWKLIVGPQGLNISALAHPSSQVGSGSHRLKAISRSLTRDG